MALKIIIEKYKITNFVLVFFVYLLAIVVNERSHTTSLAFEEGPDEHFWGPKYGFTTGCPRKFQLNFCLFSLFALFATALIIEK